MKIIFDKAVDFFLDHINWCHETYSNGKEKEPTWFFNFWCYLFWPIPWMEELYNKKPCWCCASVRGVIYGVLLGIVGSYLWGIWV